MKSFVEARAPNDFVEVNYLHADRFSDEQEVKKIALRWIQDVVAFTGHFALYRDGDDVE